MRVSRRIRSTLKTRPVTRSAQGYILISLMLFVTLLAIAALAVLPRVAQQIKRDQEEEMIHRGVQYTRAVGRYYKKMGRYPTRIEELENTNNIRFLRKRYKDPITGKDFKIVRMTDVNLGTGPVLPGASGFVGAQGGGLRQAGPGDANTPQVTGLPQPANSDTGDQSDSSNPSDAKGTPATKASSPLSPSPGGLGGQVFGGGPMLGVASTSKAKSIREFNDKNHYNDWLFIYDPTTDRGGLINGPWQQGKGFGVMPGAGGPGQGVGVQGQPQPNSGPSFQTTPQQGQGPGQGPNPTPEPMPPDQ